MKRLAQLAAVLTIGLIVAQPVLFGLPCALGMPLACTPGCPMAMNGMGADCPMASSGMATSACSQSCCTQAAPQAAPPLIAREKLNIAALAPALAVHAAACLAGPAAVLPPPVESAASSPPTYLLNQVFRI